MKKIGFIGAGNMAFALAKAFVRNDSEIKLNFYDISKAKLDFISQEFKYCSIKNSSVEVVHDSDSVILAVKPQDIDTVLKEIEETDCLIISIAAGVTLEHLESYLINARVFRVMPNTPSIVGEMAAGFAAGSGVKESDTDFVEKLLRYAGTAIKVEEKLIDAVTGLSGSGPAFFALLFQAFIDAAKMEGLTEATARELTLKTVSGTAKLLSQTGMTTKELVKMVSSPNGTTVAGRNVLEASNYKEIIAGTVSAATARSRELGE